MKWGALLCLSGCFLFRGPDPVRCPADRTIVLASQADVTAFAVCHSASSVVIRTGASLDTSPLRELVEISGDLVIGPTVGIDEIALYNLKSVGGAVKVISNGSLRGLFLPLLERAGRIDIENNVSLTAFIVPRLHTLPGSLVVTDNYDLEMIDASQLESIDNELVIDAQPKLTIVELPKLVHAASVRIDGTPKLGPDVVDALRAKAAPP